MADTKKTITQLLAILADGQPAGSITAQDIRDMLVSLGQSPRGAIYFNGHNAVETVISAVDTYTKVLGATVLQSGPVDCDMPANNRIRYTGLIPVHFHIECPFSIVAASNNKIFGTRIFVYDDSAGSGAAQLGSQIDRKIATSGDEGLATVMWDVVLDENDYIELHVENQNNDSNVTITHLYLSMWGHNL